MLRTGYAEVKPATRDEHQGKVSLGRSSRNYKRPRRGINI